MKSKVGVFLLGILVFLLGGIAGAVSHNLYREHVQASTPKAPPPPPPDIIEGFAKMLELDVEQKESLRGIFEQSLDRYRVLAKEFMPHYEAIRNETDQQIKDILNDNQKKKYEDFLKKFQPKPPPKPNKSAQ